MTARRAPDATRQRLLDAAFAEMHRAGYRAASLDRILAETDVTKGALYYHFANKHALGEAVINERVRLWVETRWKPMLEADQPLQAAIDYVRAHIDYGTDEALALGCPFANLAQELGSTDPVFGKLLQGIFTDWKHGIAAGVRKSQAIGEGRTDVDPDDVAIFVISAIEGCWAMAKATRCREHFAASHRGMIQYLEAMRA